MKVFLILTLRALVVAACCLVGGGVARAATTVACVGDSITQGSGWPARLGTRLGAEYAVANHGVSATTLLKNGDFPYWATPAFTQSHTSNPAIVVIMLGTNDSKPQNWNAHKGEFAADYAALIDSYRALPSQPRIFITLCPPAGTNGFGISGAVIENEILPLIRQVAAAKGVGTIDVFSAFGGRNFDPALFGSAADQVHPGGAGAQRIADAVYAALVAAADGGAGDGPAMEAGRDTTGETAAETTADRPAATDGSSVDSAPGEASTAAAFDAGGLDRGGVPADAGAVDAGAPAMIDAPLMADAGKAPSAAEAAGCGCALARESAGGASMAVVLFLALAMIGLRGPRRARRQVCCKVRRRRRK